MKHKWITEGEVYGKKVAGKDWKEPYVHAAEDMGEYHNGPKCKTCGFQFCHHCFPEGYKTKCGVPSLNADDSKLSEMFVALDRSMKKQMMAAILETRKK